MTTRNLDACRLCYTEHEGECDTGDLFRAMQSEIWFLGRIEQAVRELMVDLRGGKTDVKTTYTDQIEMAAWIPSGRKWIIRDHLASTQANEQVYALMRRLGVEMDAASRSITKRDEHDEILCPRCGRKGTDVTLFYNEATGVWRCAEKGCTYSIRDGSTKQKSCRKRRPKEREKEAEKTVEREPTEARLRNRVRRTARDKYQETKAHLSAEVVGIICEMTGIDDPAEAIRELTEDALARWAHLVVLDRLATSEEDDG